MALFFLLLTFFIGEKQPKNYSGDIFSLNYQNHWTLFKGENKAFIDSNLSVAMIKKFVHESRGVWWLETKVEMSEKYIKQDDLWFYMRQHMDAFELYVNGQFLFKNGDVGQTIEEENDGRILFFEKIPAWVLRDGKNTVSIKSSNMHTADASILVRISITPYERMRNMIDEGIYIAIFLAGFFLLAMISNLSLYFAYNRKVTFIILTLFFSCYFILMARDYIYWGENPLVGHVPFLHQLRIVTAVLGEILLLTLLIFEFQLSKKPWRLSLIAAGFVIAVNYLEFNLYNIKFFAPTVCAFAISVWGVYKKKDSGVFILIGVMSLLYFMYLAKNEGFNFGHMFGILVFAIAMIISVSKNIFVQNKALQESKLLSSRLENQLLQKHIQPHFLMNSLMSLQELVDVDTKAAGKLIDDLSQEFHLLAEISKEQLIPINDEIEVCQVHLRIMEFQKQSQYHFETKGILGNEMVPPAIFHTLVENGLTHGYTGIQDGSFCLEKQTNGHSVIYKMFNDSHTVKKEKKQNGGTGLSYVKARLEESYPGRWELTSEAVEQGWETRIEIKDQV